MDLQYIIGKLRMSTFWNHLSPNDSDGPFRDNLRFCHNVPMSQKILLKTIVSHLYQFLQIIFGDFKDGGLIMIMNWILIHMNIFILPLAKNWARETLWKTKMLLKSDINFGLAETVIDEMMLSLENISQLVMWYVS